MSAAHATKPGQMSGGKRTRSPDPSEDNSDPTKRSRPGDLPPPVVRMSPWNAPRPAVLQWEEDPATRGRRGMVGPLVEAAGAGIVLDGFLAGVTEVLGVKLF